MKNVIHIIVFALLGLFFTPNSAFAQLYEVPLDDKIEQSTLIVEGKVVESQCYRADNGDIYTANKVALGSILKGAYHEKFLTITTWGGEMDDEGQTWTHLLTLHKGDYGMFFLEPTRVPAIPTTGFPVSFDVYAGQQGFLALVQNEVKAWVAYEPFHTYTNVEADLYQYIARKTGQAATVVNPANAAAKKTGIRYHFTDIVFDGTTIGFKVYVNSLTDAKQLYRSGLQLNYNPDFFGANLATNGNLSLYGAGISTSSTYSLTQSNVSSSKVKIELTAVGSLTGLATIGTSEQLLAEGKLTIQNMAADPGITYSLAEMQSMSKFYQGGLVQTFDTVVVEGDWRPFSPFCPPVLTSFSPTKLDAGTFDTLSIVGTCFGATKGVASKVEFRNSATGFYISNDWVEPLDSNYILWSDALIKVIVPSFVKGADITKSAGTGKIRVTNTFGTGVSTTDLTIRFAALNAVTSAFDIPANKTIPLLVRNLNGLGGVSIYYTYKFKADTNAVKAFERALKRWRCATLINYKIQDSAIIANLSNASKIEFRDLGVGALTTLASTNNIPYIPCTATPLIAAYRRRFSIAFNSNSAISWHSSIAMSATLPANTYDLESRATHELGHAHLLNHSNNIEDLMYWTDSFPPYIYRRDIMPNDLAGGLFISNQSSTFISAATSCSSPMQPILLADCNNASGTKDLTINYSSAITISPNPNFGLLHIKLEDNIIPFSSRTRVRIYNSISQPILDRWINSNNETLDIIGLNPGFYYLQFFRENSLIGVKSLIKI